MQKNKWSRNFEWIQNDVGTYVQKYKSENYDEDLYIAVGDIYFRLNKYLTGVTFNYINNLDNVYKKDLLTGDGYSIVNMYNEYDLIDYAMKNFMEVDIASDVHIDLKSKIKIINGVDAKPGHVVLLKNQEKGDEHQNEIYRVNNNYFLEKYYEIKNVVIGNGKVIQKKIYPLENKELSEKFSCGVKLGVNSGKQFFLLNVGDDFPTIGEPKYFIEGKSYIIKNVVNYNLYNTSEEKPLKIIFTDYDVARKQIDENFFLYDDIYFSIGKNMNTYSFFDIRYHYQDYIIRNSFKVSKLVTYSGSTSTIKTSITTEKNSKVKLFIPYESSYYDFKYNDYVKLRFYNNEGTDFLTFKEFISKIENNYIVIDISIPEYILTILLNTSNQLYFEIDNLNASTNYFNAFEKMKMTPYSDFFDIELIGNGESVQELYYDVEEPKMMISAKKCDYEKYFDYDGISFFNSGVTKFFETNNQIVNYNLFDTLNRIDENIFTEDFIVYEDHLLTSSGNSINEEYIDYRYIDGNTGDSVVNENTTTIKITISRDNLVNLSSHFKPYTYVILNSNVNYIAMVHDVEKIMIVVEKPLNFSGVVTSVENIVSLKNISDLLYTVYINEENYISNWYVRKSDNERKYIANAYAEILTNNKVFRDNVTGIIYENKNNEFVFKLYNFDGDYQDDNLTYSMHEIINVGFDRKTKLPIPAKSVIFSKSEDEIEDWNYINGGMNEFNLEKYIENFVLGNDSVLPGPSYNNYPFYTNINGGIDNV